MRTQLPYENPAAYCHYFARRLSRAAKVRDVRERLGLPSVDRTTWIKELQTVRKYRRSYN